jgi:branched-chain amino acid aminotransferase
MLKVFTPKEFLSRLKQIRYAHQDNYLAMYSSVLGGVVTHPEFMLIPIDDHIVHRGDGVFEVFKCQRGRIYQLEAHLRRLQDSIQALGLKLPVSTSSLKGIVRETIKITQVKDCLIHIYLSRGPGGFSVNPFETIGTQLYVVVTKLIPLPKQYFQSGVKVIISRVPPKPDFFAKIKSCNYLPNVLMKKEALERGAHYAVGMDEDGYLTEGSTENFGLVSVDGYLKFPKISRILKGVTLERAFFLAQDLVKQGMLKEVSFCSITLEDVYEAKEVLLLGTTFNILPVVFFEGQTIGSGNPGRVFVALKELFEKDLYLEGVSEPI